jgi:ribosomal protein L37E
MNTHEEWDCPTCGRPTPPSEDYECGCCGNPASEHISVTSLCRILRETQQREHALIVENKRLKAELEEKELYIQRVITWPYDADPFCSPDHDNDSPTYQ